MSQEAAAGKQAAADNRRKTKPGKGEDEPPQPEKERVRFLELVKQNPNYFGTLPISELQPVNPIKSDTRYEELKCIGLYPERNFLEAFFRSNCPTVSWAICAAPAARSTYASSSIGTATATSTISTKTWAWPRSTCTTFPEVRQFHLCYALGKAFRALRASCQKPYIVKLRAILSWQQVPTGPNFIPVWGNILECWIQIRPTEPAPTAYRRDYRSAWPRLHRCASA